MQLMEQRATDVANANHRQGQTSTLLEKRLVDDVQRADLLAGVDDARDVPLRRSLGNRADVDVVASQRAEHLPRHAGPPFHPVAHDGHNGLPRRVVEAGELLLHLEPKLGLEGIDRSRRVRTADGEADRVLGRGL